MMHIRVVLEEHAVGRFGVGTEGAAETSFEALEDVGSVWATVIVKVVDMIGGVKLYPDAQGAENKVVSLRLRTPDADTIVDLL